MGVEEASRPYWSPHAQQPWSSWACWHRSSHGARPLDVGLRHATGLHGPLGPRTLPCLTLGWTIGLWSAPRWAGSWGCPWRRRSGEPAATSTRWGDKPQCSAARQYPALELLLLQKSPLSHDAEQQNREAGAHEAPPAADAAKVDKMARPVEACPGDVQLGASPLDAAEMTEGALLGQGRPPLEPLLLEEAEQLPEGLVREDSEWSFLSHSLRTVDSVDLNEDLDSSDDDRPMPDAPRWRRMRDYFWSAQPPSP